MLLKVYWSRDAEIWKQIFWYLRRFKNGLHLGVKRIGICRKHKMKAVTVEWYCQHSKLESQTDQSSKNIEKIRTENPSELFILNCLEIVPKLRSRYCKKTQQNCNLNKISLITVIYIKYQRSIVWKIAWLQCHKIYEEFEYRNIWPEKI